MYFKPFYNGGIQLSHYSLKIKGLSVLCANLVLRIGSWHRHGQRLWSSTHTNGTLSNSHLASLVTQTVSGCLQCRRPGFNPWVKQIPWRRKWPPTLWQPILFQNSCLERILSMDRGDWWATVHGHKEPDMTEQQTLSLSVWTLLVRGKSLPLG